MGIVLSITGSIMGGWHRQDINCNFSILGVHYSFSGRAEFDGYIHIHE